MTFLMFLSVILLGSLVLNYADFVRSSGFLRTKPAEYDYAFSGVLLASIIGSAYVISTSLGSVASDHAWKYFIVGFVALVYLVLVGKGIASYWSLRRLIRKRAAAGAGKY
jgi:predicted small integral membrane protein